MAKESKLIQEAELLLELTKDLRAHGREPYSLATLCGASFMGTVDAMYNDVYRRGEELLSDIINNPATAKSSYRSIINRNLASIAARDPEIYARHTDLV